MEAAYSPETSVHMYGGGDANYYFLLFATYNSLHFLLYSMLCYHSIPPAILIFLLHESLNQG
jgi:hypothetical protein